LAITGVLQNGFAPLEFSSSAQKVSIGVVFIIALPMSQAAQALGKKAPVCAGEEVCERAFAIVVDTNQAAGSAGSACNTPSLCSMQGGAEA